MMHARFLILCGPATTGVPVLSGRAKRAGSDSPSFPNSIWERNCPRNSIASAGPPEAASCGLACASPLGQHTHAWRCRATRYTYAHLYLFSLLIAAPFAQAQTNTADALTTNAPAYFAPAPAPVSSPLNLSNAPGQPPAQADALEDIRPPFFYLHSWSWLWIALGVIIAIALLVLLWFWLRPRRLLSPKSAYELALEKLEKARALLHEDNPMPYAVLISETIRSYLGQRFQAPSTHRTTEEFFRQMESNPTTPLAEHRDLLRDFLQSCDLVKFARYQPTLTELEQVQQRATTFVTATKPLPASVPKNGR
jgi:hypothetical protein